jgi:signal transduction histidine kinase
MVSSFATGPYTALLPDNRYLCRLNFCGWTLEVLTNALHAGFASFNNSSLWEQCGGPYRAGEIAFQGNCMLRTGLIRIGRPFRIWSGLEKGPAAEAESFACRDAAGQDTRELMEARRADFSSMAIHDMKSSLVLIGGFIQRLTDSPEADPERQRRYLEIIKKEGSKLEALLEDFLACTGVTGESRLEIKPICLDRELKDLCEAHQLKASRRQINLKLEQPPRLSLVLADMRRLQRVFGNLLDNALKFSPPASTVRVAIRETNQEVRISFADDGPGIDARDLPYLFDAHYRGRIEGSQTEGSGLGLATVKAIVEAHGGRVLAENRAKTGAVFTVILPRDGSQGLEKAGTASKKPHQQSVPDIKPTDHISNSAAQQQ